MSSARQHSAALADLLRREHGALADFVVALADFDRRRLWQELGHGSLFNYLHRELGLSKSAAFYRKTAAELLQRIPEVVEPLRDGRLCFTSVVELSKVITSENRHEVLPRFFHCSKQEAKAVSAAIKPVEAAPQRTVVTTLRARAAAPALALTTAYVPGADDGIARLVLPEEPRGSTSGQVLPEEPRQAGDPPHAAPTCQPPRPFTTEPVSAELARVHLTVPLRLLEKLEKARAALSRSHPGASEPEILEAALDLLIQRDEKRKGLVKKPRPEPRPSQTDLIPAHVKRAVWKRDGGKCQWPLEGGVCGSTHKLQFDHAVPRGRGGPPTFENIRLLCQRHNDAAARRTYGDEWMDRFTRRRAGPP